MKLIASIIPKRTAKIINKEIQIKKIYVVTKQTMNNEIFDRTRSILNDNNLLNIAE